jgi:arsenate reductase
MVHMPSDYTLWFNPRCSKCRQALEILQVKGIEPELRLYIENPPKPAELDELLRKLDLAPHAVARTGEEEYRSLQLSEHTTRSEMIEALARHPRLIERPILVRGNRAVICRPPERVLELVGG